MLVFSFCNGITNKNENILGHWQVINSEYPFLYGTECVSYTIEEKPIRFTFNPDSILNFFPGSKILMDNLLGIRLDILLRITNSLFTV